MANFFCHIGKKSILQLLECYLFNFGAGFENGHIVIHCPELKVVDAARSVGREGKLAVIPKVQNSFQVVFPVLKVVVLAFHSVLVVLRKHQGGDCL